MRRMMAASPGAGSSGGGVTVDGVNWGHDGVPIGAARRQFTDLDAPVRSWKIGASHYREAAGGIELLAVSGDGAGRWTDYTGPYFASADEMAVADEPGEPGPGTKVREAWAVKHAEMLRDEAFALATDDSTTGREHTLLSERQQLRADGAVGLRELRIADMRLQLRDQDRAERLNDSTREARGYEARLEHLRRLPGLEPGTREAALRSIQVRSLKDKIESFGAAVGRKLPEDVTASRICPTTDLTAIYGPLD